MAAVVGGRKGTPMSRVVIIGGSGHVGTYLVPRLVSAELRWFQLAAERAPHSTPRRLEIRAHGTLSREAEEKAGAFGPKIRDLRPDIVIDMICFTEPSARHLVEALRGQVRHFLHTGTIWVHGPSVEVPTTEMQPRRPFGEYRNREGANRGVSDRDGAEKFVSGDHHPSRSYRGAGLGAANPAGHFNPRVFTMLAKGEELALPNFGLETSITCTPTTSPRCSCARSLIGAHRWGRPSTPFRRQRSRFAVMPRRWRHGSAANQIALPAMATMEERAKRAGGGADLRPHRAQPQLQYRQGGAHARLSAALWVDRGGTQISELADREGDRSGLARSALRSGALECFDEDRPASGNSGF